MKIVSVSHMFPNSINPHIGVFVKERVKHVAIKTELIMVAPVQSFPFIDYTTKYAGLSQLRDEETIDGITVHHPKYFMIPKYFKTLDAIFYGRSLAQFMESLANRTDFDIFDFHWVYPDAIGGLQWARKLGKKTVVTVRGNEAIYYFDKSYIRKIIQKRLSEFDHIIAVSNDLKSKIRSDFGVDLSRITVIPNGIDAEKFRCSDKGEARRYCGLEDGKRYVLTVSRASKEKGLAHLLVAFSRVRCPDTFLIIIGDGPLQEELTSLAVELGLEKRVFFLGVLRHADLCVWYNAADIFCLPSLWEGCPNVIIEALACGTPVVASCVGGIPDLVPSSDYGFLVPPGEEDTLAKAIERALEKEWNRRHISAFGSNNSWTDVADKVIQVFEGVLK